MKQTFTKVKPNRTDECMYVALCRARSTDQRRQVYKVIHMQKVNSLIISIKDVCTHINNRKSSAHSINCISKRFRWSKFSLIHQQFYRWIKINVDPSKYSQMRFFIGLKKKHTSLQTRLILDSKMPINANNAINVPSQITDPIDIDQKTNNNYWMIILFCVWLDKRRSQAK